MSTPPKAPKQTISQARVNELFFKNLEEIKRYLQAQDEGPHVGHNINAELNVGYTAQAWECAMQGYAWRPGIFEKHGHLPKHFPA